MWPAALPFDGLVYNWDQLDRFVVHVLADKRHYDLHEVLIPDVKAIFKWIAEVPAAQLAASRLLQHCLTELRAATAHPIEPPQDWRRDAELGCNCEDCRAMSRFRRSGGACGLPHPQGAPPASPPANRKA